MADIRETLNERSKTHGSYSNVALVSCRLMEVVQEGFNKSDKSAERVPPELKLAFQMITHKLARAACGNTIEIDHWRDIVGYAQLVVDHLDHRTVKS